MHKVLLIEKKWNNGVLRKQRNNPFGGCWRELCSSV